MRHLPMALVLILYVLIIGQNWGIYIVALMMYAYARYQGNANSVLFGS